MNSIEYEKDDLRDLLMRLMDDELSPEENSALAEILRNDAEARAMYHDLIEVHALLRWQHGPVDDLLVLESDNTATIENEMGLSVDSLLEACVADEQDRQSPPSKDKKDTKPVLGFLAECFQQGASFLSKSNVFSLLLTVGLPGILLLVMALQIMRQPVPTPPPLVATLTRTYECDWGETDVFPVVGARLTPGQRLSLREGLAEITFANGATVLLEGPSTFQADGRSKGFLYVGSLIAKVTKGAEGFAVRTPSAIVVDLGTEFGLSVAKDGTAEAHVFKGEVEVITRPPMNQVSPTKKHLVAGQAVRISTGKVPQLVAMAAKGNKFARHVPGTLAKPTIIFAHRGSADPTTEGWQLVKPDRDAANKADIELGPVEENGTAAWSFHKKGGMAYTEISEKVEYYTIQKVQGLDPKLIAEAKKKGWVMRARVWISDQSARVGEQSQGLSTFHYCDGEQDWGLHPTLSRNGDQLLLLVDPDSTLNAPGSHGGAIPVPNSSNRYVDYEVRYHPATKSADVFINGRRVATGFSRFRRKSTPLLRFGTTSFKLASDVRFALFEWGILREPDEAANAKHGEATTSSNDKR